MISTIAVALLHASAGGVEYSRDGVFQCTVGRMYYAIGPARLQDVINRVGKANGFDVIFDPRDFEHPGAEVAGVGGYYTAREAGFLWWPEPSICGGSRSDSRAL